MGSAGCAQGTQASVTRCCLSPGSTGSLIHAHWVRILRLGTSQQMQWLWPAQDRGRDHRPVVAMGWCCCLDAHAAVTPRQTCGTPRPIHRTPSHHTHHITLFRSLGSSFAPHQTPHHTNTLRDIFHTSHHITQHRCLASSPTQHPGPVRAARCTSHFPGWARCLAEQQPNAAGRYS